MALRPRTVVEVLVGVGAPAVATAVLHRTGEPAVYRPGSVLVFVMAVVAVTTGFRAGLLAAATSIASIWLYFTEPVGSAKVGTASDVASLLVFTVTAAGILLLVQRLERARRAELEQRQVAEALLDGAPLGVGLFDGQGRLRRHNAALARMQTRSQASVDELLQDRRHRQALSTVLREERPVTDVRISRGASGEAAEHHWRANYYPVRRGAVEVGAGVIVTDITGDVVGRRRSELLLRLAGELSAAPGAPQLAAVLHRFLEEVFRAPAGVALVTADGQPAEGSIDPASPARTAWHEAARTGTIAFAADAAEHDERFPDGAADRAAVHGQACLAAPVCDPGEARPRAVYWVWWPHGRPLTDTARTLAETVASMAALALTRIELTDAVQRDRFRAALDAMIDDVAIGRAVRDARGTIVDFVLEFVNRASLDGARRTADALLGRSVCELYPSWRATGMFDRFAEVVETGRPMLADRLPYRDELADGTVIDGYWNVHVVKLGDGYLAASLDVTDVVAAEDARRAAEAAGERERTLVALLQHASLPQRLPERDGVRFGARYRPALSRQVVGGDWYDAFAVGDRLALVIGDVAGHGPDAAARMVQVRQLVRAIALQDAEPEVVLRRVNDTMTALEPEGGFITCCFAVLDPATATLAVASAGHPPAVLLGAGCSADGFVAPRPGPPLAAVGGATYQSVRQPIDGGARLVLYTDGLVERRGEPIDVGLDRLLDAVRDGAGRSADALAALLADAVEDPEDDIAVLVVDIDPIDP